MRLFLAANLPALDVKIRQDFLWGDNAVGRSHKEGTADPLLPFLEMLFKATVHTMIMNCNEWFYKVAL